MGEKSPKALVSSTKLVETAFKTSRLSIMPGQGHNAMTTAPDLFIREVVYFLLA
jgi:pimeloyl-ACP methyl ester carboxylesterase